MVSCINFLQETICGLIQSLSSGLSCNSLQVVKNVAHHPNLSHILNLMITDSPTTVKTKRLGIDSKARLMKILCGLL
jgi:hypothetical protein